MGKLCQQNNKNQDQGRRAEGEGSRECSESLLEENNNIASRLWTVYSNKEGLERGKGSRRGRQTSLDAQRT